jgi:hypothetical protein
MQQGECDPDRILKALKTQPLFVNGKATFPNGTPDGGTLLHAAAKFGCNDVALKLIIEQGLDPYEEASGMGHTGMTAYGFCEEQNRMEISKGK